MVSEGFTARGPGTMAPSHTNSPGWPHTSPRWSTTEVSGENRTTAIKNVEREGNMLLLQGAESGRAFSFAIHEVTGMASIAVAAEDRGVLVFGACTPTPVVK